jgi:hypothetical protein
MGLFEQHPWMLVLMVILIAEGWSAAKTMMARVLRRGISRLGARGYEE